MRKAISGFLAAFVLFFTSAGVEGGQYTDVQLSKNISYSASALWTGLMDVEVVSNYAFGVFWDGLGVFDVRKPANPVLVEKKYLHGRGNGIDVEGTRAYIADMFAGLKVIDVSNPYKVNLLGTVRTPGDAFSVFVSGNLAFVAAEFAGLAIYDVTNPAAMTLVGSYKTAGLANDIFVLNGRAYISEGCPGVDIHNPCSSFNGIEVVDVSVPASPALLGTYVSTGATNAVQVVGTTAYIAETTGGFTILNVTNPPNIYTYGNYPVPMAVDVSVANGYAYVLDRDLGVHNIDITIPSNPVLRGRYDTPDWSYKLFVTGGLLYTADGWSASLNILDVSVPSSDPVLKGAWGQADEINGVHVEGGVGYVTSNNGLWLADVSNPLAPPAVIGSLQVTGFPWRINVRNSYAYIAGRTHFTIVDCANPAAPVEVWNYPAPGGAYGITLDPTSAYAYLAEGTAGIKIFDIRNPRSPVLLSSLPIRGISNNLMLNGNTLFVAARAGGLVFVDVTDPMFPVEAGAYRSGGSVTAVLARNGYAYIAEPRKGVSILDVNDLKAPKLLSTFKTSGNGKDLEMVNNLLFLADGPEHMQIINVSDPLKPRRYGYYIGPGYSSDLFIVDRTAYSANFASLLLLSF